MSKGKDLDDAPGGTGREKRPRVSEIVDMVQMPEGKFKKVRPVGKAFTYGTHWVKVKKKDGGETAFPTPCIAFDPETGRQDSTKNCAWCKSKSDKISFRPDNFINVIDRAAQRAAPDPDDNQPTKTERKTGFKDKSSETYTIYRVLSVPPSLLAKIKDAKQLNTHEDENGDTVAYGVAHNKYGRDINVMYDGKKKGTDKYSMQLGDVKPWTKAERAFLQWDLSDLIELPSEEEVEKEYKSWAKRNLDEDEDEEEKPKSKKRPKDEDFDEDEDEDIKPSKKKRPSRDEDDFDEDEEEKPKSKKKARDEDFDDDEPPKKPKKKPARDEDEDELPLDEDEDEPPKKPKKKPARDEDEDEDEKPKAKKKPARDEDEDEDEDEPPKKPKKRPSRDEDDFDEDEEEKPKAKKKRPKDEDEDEDEEEKPKSKAKKRPKDEDDFDDL